MLMSTTPAVGSAMVGQWVLTMGAARVETVVGSMVGVRVVEVAQARVMRSWGRGQWVVEIETMSAKAAQAVVRAVLERRPDAEEATAAAAAETTVAAAAVAVVIAIGPRRICRGQPWWREPQECQTT